MIFVIWLLIGSILPVAQSAPSFLPVTGADLTEMQAPDMVPDCPVVRYKVRLPKPSCFMGFCIVYAWVPVNGRTDRLVRITGRNLRQDQMYSGTYPVCSYR
jgi:hypothetical protein